MAKIFDKLLKVLINIELISYLISDSLISCAPLPSDELCSVNLVPNELIAKRFQDSVITIRCEATLDSRLLSESFEFTNPVFDLSFGGAPRTGLFILRGNPTCDGPRVKCWSEYQISANSIGHLIHHSGSIIYSCQVADQLRSTTNKTLARCQNTGTLGFSNTLNYGDPCSSENTSQECDKGMECGAPETENEVESPQQCICRNGLVSIPISYRNTVCLEEVPLDSICNYTKQCSAVDSNSVCDRNQNDIKVCQCSQDSIESTEYQTDYIKKCRIKPKTTTTTTTTTTASTDEDESQEVTTIIELGETYLNKSGNLVEGNYRVTPNNDKTGNVGIVLFFVAIFLAIIIVVIIIRARNKSDKMVVNRKTIEQQTDGIDGEQNEPILTTDKSGGVDEVDATDDEGVKSTYSNGDDKRLHNQINDSQKVQTNV